MLIFVALLFVGMPIAICIGMSTLAALLMNDISGGFIAQISFSGLDSFTYLAIPMFIMAGFVMETGGLSRRIVGFASTLVGRTTGGLGIVTVIACMFFAAISGSSPATVAAIGSMMVPSMIEKGYNRHFAGALTASAGSLGILIPPSIPMIIYAVTAEISIGDMFCRFYSRRNGWSRSYFNSISNCKNVVMSAWLKSLTVRKYGRLLGCKMGFINASNYFGGIYSGVFTATEAAFITVIYTLVVSLFVHKEITLKDIRPIVVKSAITTGCVIILGFATAFARYLTMSQIPQMIGEAILQVTDNPTIILLIFVALIMFTGLFIETAAQILIYTSILTNFGSIGY
ncbi:TRAP transporter large permease [Vibrio taketomensis]|uniref:TRAP transporter large permease n=1 Tax=Vibrio taketomensis TaxID=2572923 RepID=UPI001E41A758|nr:TRAP transporter large permease [Vibrio taketomensis]